jgi:multiple sugar transport system permease protein
MIRSEAHPISLTTRRLPLGRALGRAVLYAVVIAGAVLYAMPFVWMLSTSLKPDYQISGFSVDLVPRPPTLSNYPRAFSSIPFLLCSTGTRSSSRC